MAGTSCYRSVSPTAPNDPKLRPWIRDDTVVLSTITNVTGMPSFVCGSKQTRARSTQTDAKQLSALERLQPVRAATAHAAAQTGMTGGDVARLEGATARLDSATERTDWLEAECAGLREDAERLRGAVAAAELASEQLRRQLQHVREAGQPAQHDEALAALRSRVSELESQLSQQQQQQDSLCSSQQEGFGSELRPQMHLSKQRRKSRKESRARQSIVAVQEPFEELRRATEAAKNAEDAQKAAEASVKRLEAALAESEQERNAAVQSARDAVQQCTIVQQRVNAEQMRVSILSEDLKRKDRELGERACEQVRLADELAEAERQVLGMREEAAETNETLSGDADRMQRAQLRLLRRIAPMLCGTFVADAARRVRKSSTPSDDWRNAMRAAAVLLERATDALVAQVVEEDEAGLEDTLRSNGPPSPVLDRLFSMTLPRRYSTLQSFRQRRKTSFFGRSSGAGDDGLLSPHSAYGDAASKRSSRQLSQVSRATSHADRSPTVSSPGVGMAESDAAALLEEVAGELADGGGEEAGGDGAGEPPEVQPYAAVAEEEGTAAPPPPPPPPPPPSGSPTRGGAATTARERVAAAMAQKVAQGAGSREEWNDGGAGDEIETEPSSEGKTEQLAELRQKLEEVEQELLDARFEIAQLRAHGAPSVGPSGSESSPVLRLSDPPSVPVQWGSGMGLPAPVRGANSARRRASGPVAGPRQADTDGGGKSAPSRSYTWAGPSARRGGDSGPQTPASPSEAPQKQEVNRVRDALCAAARAVAVDVGLGTDACGELGDVSMHLTSYAHDGSGPDGCSPPRDRRRPLSASSAVRGQRAGSLVQRPKSAGARRPLRVAPAYLLTASAATEKRLWMGGPGPRGQLQRGRSTCAKIQGFPSLTC